MRICDSGISNYVLSLPNEDLVKTRMQYERNNPGGTRLHKNSLNCAANVIRNEGFLKLYSGLGTQLIGGL